MVRHLGSWVYYERVVAIPHSAWGRSPWSYFTHREGKNALVIIGPQKRGAQMWPIQRIVFVG